MFRVDLNSDIGESFGAYKLGCDEEILKNITSANVACGFHAGDPMVMEKTIRICKENGVRFGAHPGYPDLMGFGRRNMKLSRAEAKAYTKYQLGALMAFAAGAGLKVQHLKAHGAFGNTSAKDEEMARGICEAVAEVDPGIIILSFGNQMVTKIAAEMGLRYANEVFADRGYMDDLTLVPRGQQGAMITDPELAAKRVVRMIKEGVVTTITGKEVEIPVHSVCVHGDSLGAVQITADLRKALEEEGIGIASLDEIIA